MNIYSISKFTPSHKDEAISVKIRSEEDGSITIRELDLASCLRVVHYEQPSVSEPYYYGVDIKSLFDIVDHIRKVLSNEGVL